MRIFGIRHHGPGSARSLLASLADYQPDALLIEGPPEGDELLSFVNDPAMQPPVALLAYMPDQPQRAAFYPFAEFSPEWQALRFGLARDIPVHFMDLPQRHWLALRQDDGAARAADTPAESAPDAEHRDEPFVDPLDALAVAAGFDDGERWWEHLVEERPQASRDGAAADAGADASDIFVAVMEMMCAARAASGAPDEGEGPALGHLHADPLGPVREAAMRQAIRAAQGDGRERIAVVCGAWHAPALDLAAANGALPSAKEDAAALKGLPKVPVKLTWVAWGYEHLARFSGYGAGAVSPGWYEHLWQHAGQGGQTAIRWLARVAQLLRERDLDASAAQVVDAARLADALAAMRGLPRPGLDELNQAALTALCFGNPLPLEVVGRELIVGTKLGHVPDAVPMVPLAQDLAAAESRLRFPRLMHAKQFDLDLRQPTDLARSQLLHRLRLLDIPWGKPEGVRGAKGTFHELWTVQWQPAFEITVIERAVWGNTVATASAAYARRLADEARDLSALTDLLDRSLLADLGDAAAYLITRIQEQSALSGDIGRLMDALPALARTLRYGNVRQDAPAAEGSGPAVDSALVGDHSVVGSILDGMVTRICIGLPLACASLDDDAAAEMLQRIEGVHASLAVAGLAEASAAWQVALRQLADQQGLHGLIAGRCCRLLFEQGAFDAEELDLRLGLALSVGSEPSAGAAWLAGLLRGSGMLLLHEDALWGLLDQWVSGLPGAAFTSVLPLLRRTFAAFSAPERRQMGERVRRGASSGTFTRASMTDIDVARADAVLPVIRLLLGLDAGQTTPAGDLR